MIVINTTLNVEHDFNQLTPQERDRALDLMERHCLTHVGVYAVQVTGKPGVYVVGQRTATTRKRGGAPAPVSVNDGAPAPVSVDDGAPASVSRVRHVLVAGDRYAGMFVPAAAVLNSAAAGVAFKRGR